MLAGVRAARPPAGVGAARRRRLGACRGGRRGRAARVLRRGAAAGRPRSRAGRSSRRRARCGSTRRCWRRTGRCAAAPPGCPMRRARTCSSWWPSPRPTVGRSQSRSTRTPPASASSAATRYDATRSLGHVTFDGAAGERAGGRRRRAARARVVPRAGADRGGVAGRGRDRADGVGRLREGALHVRPRDRLLPGGQAQPDRGAAPAREHLRAAAVRRLGLRGRAATSSRWRPAPRAPPAATRWTTRAAR